jgi:hypothetical protein
MVCIAAFIILALISVVVAFLSIFKPSIGKKWWKLFKKAWYCFSKKVRLQKCDTNFQDDVKHAILKKIALKHPTWIKPISKLIEIFSVVIVVVFAWSIIIAIKSLLAIWIFGTCNVSQPSQCGLGAEACSIDQGEPTNPVEFVQYKLGEWGQIFEGIPDRLKEWKSEDYLPADAAIYNNDLPASSPLAIDIIDPGCSVCLQSYKNQLTSGFFDKYRVSYLYYPIENPDGTYKFQNSGLIVRYLYATSLYATKKANGEERFVELSSSVPEKILNRIFTESDDNGVNYQSLFNNEFSNSQAEQLLRQWLQEFGFSERRTEEISDFAHSEEISNYLKGVKTIVEDKVHAKGIPVFIYDGKKHNGLFRTE